MDGEESPDVGEDTVRRPEPARDQGDASRWVELEVIGVCKTVPQVDDCGVCPRLGVDRSSAKKLILAFQVNGCGTVRVDG